jgi:hypothetical protein
VAESNCNEPMVASGRLGFGAIVAV